MAVGVICTSNLPSDQDMIRALGEWAFPMKLFTDCCFSGVGDPAPLVCIERKKPGDVAQCINDGRFMFQAQVCKESGCDVLCLIVEGEYRESPNDGLTEIPVWQLNPRTGHYAEMWYPLRPTMSYSRLDQYLTELWRFAGIIVKRSRDVKETAAIIKALYTQFQKLADDHQSLRQIYKAPPVTAELVRPGLVRRIAAELPNVGWERSKAVAAHFRNVKEMVNAGVEEWSSLEGIGKKTARRVVASIEGRSIMTERGKVGKNS